MRRPGAAPFQAIDRPDGATLAGHATITQAARGRPLGLPPSRERADGFLQFEGRVTSATIWQIADVVD